MTISFNVEENELLLCYTPAYGADEIVKQLNAGEYKQIKRTFCVSKKILRRIDDEYEESLYFCVGQVQEKYIMLDSDVLMVKHKFFFANDIFLKQNMFVAYRNVSILKKIDEIIDKDFYVGGEWEKVNGISKEAFLELIRSFPNSTELAKYTHSRIAGILKENFDEVDKYEAIYERYVRGKQALLKKNVEITSLSTNTKIEIEQFSVAMEGLRMMLSNSEGISEMVWQQNIQKILKLLYPKYILCTREVSFRGVDGYEKRPDFLLVDVNGYIDILEIKKPSTKILTRQASYRNNYVPVREFAGAIQQIEKYIFCLNSLNDKRDVFFKHLSEYLPEGVVPQVVNPQGILLLGRSEGFNVQQQRDFELIKRQYKNIADIMTYDDLLCRLNNIIISLKMNK